MANGEWHFRLPNYNFWLKLFGLNADPAEILPCLKSRNFHIRHVFIRDVVGGESKVMSWSMRWSRWEGHST
jgi:hypothetical protein